MRGHCATRGRRKTIKTAFKSIAIDVNADVEVKDIDGAAGPLKLNGQLKGDYSVSGGLNIDAKLSLVPPFVYE